jgi:L-lactate dehydrogenase complex protein LldG
MMTTSRENILNKLRAARQPFPDAPPRPRQYTPVTRLDDSSPGALIERFAEEMRLLQGEAFVCQGDEAACDQVMRLLQAHQTTHLLAWDFQHIPIPGLQNAIRDLGITITQPDIHDEFHFETLAAIEPAEVGLTGADYGIAATGTLVVSTGPGKGRIPTVLPPAHIAVISADQLLPRLEDWIAIQRRADLAIFQERANVCLITGPSRTGDIEKKLVLGMHGPGQVQVVIRT